MLCTVINETGAGHPTGQRMCIIPAPFGQGEFLAKWRWLKRLTLALNDEYRYRYRVSKNHRSAEIVKQLQLPAIHDVGPTELFRPCPKNTKSPETPWRPIAGFMWAKSPASSDGQDADLHDGQRKKMEFAMLHAAREALSEYSNPLDAEILQRSFKTGPGKYGEGDRFMGVLVPAALMQLTNQSGYD